MNKFLIWLKHILGPIKPIEDFKNQLPHKRTCRMIQVDPKAAMDSSLRELGSGTKLSPQDAKHLKLIWNKDKK
jgi:hypothetical protein